MFAAGYAKGFIGESARTRKNGTMEIFIIFLVILLVIAVVTIFALGGELGSTKQELASAKGALASAKNELESSKKTEESGKNDLRSTEARFQSVKTELESTKSEVVRQAAALEKFELAKKRIAEARLIQYARQPVILVGPRTVGKTSLMMQWHAPWDYSTPGATGAHTESTVPFHNIPDWKKTPHFAFPDIEVSNDLHLLLQVHDFPGELESQQSIIEVARQETKRLRSASGKDLGIVLVCMFDAREALNGSVGKTWDYYNGQLFRNLKRLVAYDDVGLERLILVFNWWDEFRKGMPRCAEDAREKYCLEQFAPLISLFKGSCDKRRVCEVFTILDRTDLHHSQGAHIVKGEASRRFVAAMAGPQTADELFKEKATAKASQYFP